MEREINAQTHREHEVGTLAALLLKFDLEQEIQQLRSEGRWQSGHTAKTLTKYSDFRVVLVVIESGGRLVKHRTEGRISVHTLTGRIRFRTAEQSVELAAGQMLTLEHNIPHDVEGLSDSAFLLTIAWPGPTTTSSGSQDESRNHQRTMFSDSLNAHHVVIQIVGEIAKSLRHSRLVIT